ncbi:hypothetical protein PHSY_002344 [Pseudozyma hubeiensis SY62]|uniref:Uncharacterized protein n=1 Tax=Pseudozyma hubeiensis (strain SY62) TaxID=1305764 RepID=R9P0S7_PSEHS|nr:hypothetical protein PHSY_002344 [Pseudozyma hubeiensis SY62]GAC94771.1 hypothetical protein PHSY_002344 [Pseudozyma hubeiensis SY62]
MYTVMQVMLLGLASVVVKVGFDGEKEWWLSSGSTPAGPFGPLFAILYQYSRTIPPLYNLSIIDFDAVGGIDKGAAEIVEGGMAGKEEQRGEAGEAGGPECEGDERRQAQHRHEWGVDESAQEKRCRGRTASDNDDDEVGDEDEDGVERCASHRCPRFTVIAATPSVIHLDLHLRD